MHSKMQCRSIQKELPLVLHIIIWHESGSRSRTARVSTLASGYVTPSQQQRTISGLKETFIKRCIVKRTNKAEIRPEKQSEKAKSCREKNGMTYSWKGHKDKNRHKNRIQRSEQARLVHVKNITTLRVGPGGRAVKTWMISGKELLFSTVIGISHSGTPRFDPDFLLLFCCCCCCRRRRRSSSSSSLDNPV